jgi:hypothetical protein
MDSPEAEALEPLQSVTRIWVGQLNRKCKRKAQVFETMIWDDLKRSGVPNAERLRRCQMSDASPLLFAAIFIAG